MAKTEAQKVPPLPLPPPSGRVLPRGGGLLAVGHRFAVAVVDGGGDVGEEVGKEEEHLTCVTLSSKLKKYFFLK